jgi:hypothetical protein
LTPKQLAFDEGWPQGAQFTVIIGRPFGRLAPLNASATIPLPVSV